MELKYIDKGMLKSTLLKQKLKFEKDITKISEKITCICSEKLPPRTGVRGGRNTSINSRLSNLASEKVKLQHNIKVLEAFIEYVDTIDNI